MSTKCIAETKANTSCSRDAEIGSQYCWQHRKEVYYRYTDNILCKPEDRIDTGTYIASGSYGEIEKAGELVIKSMDYVTENGELITANVKEACFLAQYINNFISNLKCIDPDISETLHDSKLKLYLKYSGVTLDNTLFKQFDIFKKYQHILSNLIEDAKFQIDESGDISSLNASLGNIITNLNKSTDDINSELKEPELVSIDTIKDNLVYIIYQLLLLLEQMEKLDITHNDIKPSNIVINADLHVTVIDWGFVNLMSSTIKNKRGSPGFTAPEAIAKAHYGPINDIFSLGTSILFLFTYNTVTQDYIQNLYTSGKEFPELASITNDKIRDLVGSMININYKTRKSASDLIKNSIFDTYREKYADQYKFKITELSGVNNYYSSKNFEIKNRDILINWIFKICETKNTLKVFTLTCYLIDAYFSKIDLDSEIFFDLVGISCYWLASIFIYSPVVNTLNLSKINAKLNEELLNFKILEILDTLDYRIFKLRFDSDISEPNYKLVKLIMLDHNSIGKDEKDLLALYHKLETDITNIKKLINVSYTKLLENV
jgi:hypothetical protein